ncbi:MAG TPA: hypothetical protein VFY45_13230 [Baekduia sp.]|nr:hypothetical protein [Baekduia sp.]
METVLRRPCGHTAISFPDSTFRFGRDLWVFNMPCPVAEAFPILDLVEGAQPACQVPSSDTERLCPPFNGYRCTNLVQIVGNTLLHEGRCTLVEDHFLAFDYLTDDHGF